MKKPPLRPLTSTKAIDASVTAAIRDTGCGRCIITSHQTKSLAIRLKKGPARISGRALFYRCKTASAGGSDVHRAIFAAIIDFDIKVETIAFVETVQASPFNRADVDEAICTAVITLDETKAL